MKSLRHHSLSSILHTVSFLVCAVILLYGVIIFSRMLVYHAGALMAGHPYVWAGWSLHVMIAAVFAWKPVDHWMLSLPGFAGVKLNYPFVFDMISGLLWRFGFSLPLAFFVPSVVAFGGLIGVYLRFGKKLTGSIVIATFALVLFFTSGGMGLWEEVIAGRGMTALLNSSQTLTQTQHTGITFTNIFMGLLLPQRAFLLGMPVGCLLLLLVYRMMKGESIRLRTLVLAGVCAGLLPIIHTHTFMMLMCMSAWGLLVSRSNWKAWGTFAFVSGLVSLLTYGLFIFGTIQSSHFMSLNVGWYEHGGLIAWIIFWLRNWGVLIIAALVAPFVLWKKHRTLALMTLGWWLVFFLDNIVQFQPQQWDNSKLFSWVYLGFSLPVALMFSLLVRKRNIVGILVTGIFTVIACGSGFVDLVHMLDAPTHTFQMLSEGDQKLGVFARQHTAPSSVFLTSVRVANPIAMMSGRSVILGYQGWVFNYGLFYADREADLAKMYAGEAASIPLFEKYHITHVVISPEESAFEPNRTWFLSHYPRVYGDGTTEVFDVRAPLTTTK